MAVKQCISIPEDLKAKVDDYNGKNPYNLLSWSKVAQAAMSDRLKEMGIL